MKNIDPIASNAELVLKLLVLTRDTKDPRANKKGPTIKAMAVDTSRRLILFALKSDRII